MRPGRRGATGRAPENISILVYHASAHTTRGGVFLDERQKGKKDFIARGEVGRGVPFDRGGAAVRA